MRKFRLAIKAIGEFKISRFVLSLSLPALAAMTLIAWQQPARAEVMATKNETQLIAKPKPARSLQSDSELGTMYPTTPTVGSQEWKKEQDENERKEKRLKTIMQGICKGC